MIPVVSFIKLIRYISKELGFVLLRRICIPVSLGLVYLQMRRVIDNIRTAIAANHIQFKWFAKTVLGL